MPIKNNFGAIVLVQMDGPGGKLKMESFQVVLERREETVVSKRFKLNRAGFIKKAGSINLNNF